MKRQIPLFALLPLVAMTAPCLAETLCVTQSGSCPISGGAVGTPCICASSAGNIQGITRTTGTSAPAGDNGPHYCCTAAGRMGPFPSMNVAPGKICQAPTSSGLAIGQACF